MNISGLATTSALTAVENKIPSVNNLVKKADYETRVNEIEKKITDHNNNKYIITPRKSCCKISISKFSNKDKFW